MRKLINILLLIGTAVGGVLLFRIRDDVAPLRAEYAQLSAKYASFTADDPSLHSFVRVETGDPYKFAWRGHHPGGRRAVRFYSFWSYPRPFMEYAFPASDYTLRLQLRLEGDYLDAEFEDSLMPDHVRRKYGDRDLRVTGRQSPEVIAFLSDNWQRLEFVMSPVGEVTRTKPDAVNILLQVHLPRDLRDEFEAKAGSGAAAELKRVPLLYIVAGPKDGLERLVPTPQVPASARPKR